MSELEILHHDECQLLDWGESRSGGPWIKLRLKDSDYLDVFRAMDTATMKKSGHVLNVTISQGDIVPAEEKEPAYGEQAKILRLSDFFRRPEVWRAVGTDDEFLVWVRSQVCTARRLGHCNGDIVAAHVRRVAEGAGTGIKPEYSAIALCSHHHDLQHQKGESALGNKAWFDKHRIEHLQQWCWDTLKTQLGFEHWNEVPPDTMRQWALATGVERFLPEAYR